MSDDYRCQRCGYSCKYKSHILKHLNRVHMCKPILSDINTKNLIEEFQDVVEKKYFCNICGKGFPLRQTKYFHQKNCKNVKLNLNDSCSIENLSTTVALLKSEIEELKSNQKPLIVNSGTINTTINTTNNTTNNITVNNFGQENIEYLMKRLEYYWHNKAHGLIEMTKDIHFDPYHPENHTFTITNQRAKIAKIKENGEWIPKTCEEAIDDIVYSVSKEIEQFIEEKTDYLKSKFPRIVELTIKWWEKVGTEDFNEKEYKNLVRRLVEMVLIHRNVIKA